MSGAAVEVKGSAPTRRVVDVLGHLAAHETATSTTVARALGLSTSTCALVLAELHREGWVERDPELAYSLGAGLLPLAAAVVRRFPLADTGEAALAALAERAGATCSFTRLGPDGLEVLWTAGEGAPAARGQTFPATPPFGLALMLTAGDREVERWLDGSPVPLDGRARAGYRAALACLREHGVAAGRYDAAITPALADLQRLGAALGPDASALKERLQALFAPMAGQLLDADELLGAGPAGVSYLIAPVLDASGRATHQVELHLLEEGVPVARRRELVAALRETAETIALSRRTPTPGAAGSLPR